MSKNIVMDSQILTSLMACARLTDFRFNLNLVPIKGKSNSLEVGTLVHIILEHFEKAKIGMASRNAAIAIGFEAGQKYIDSGEMKNTPAESEGWVIGYNHALKTVEQYLEYYKNDSWISLECEVVKGKVLYEDDELRILWKAKLDLIVDTNQGIYPVDRKTMKQRRDTLSLNNQFTGQCLVSGTRSVIIDKIGFQSSLKPADKFQRAIVSYSADRLDEWQNEILPYYGKLLLMYNDAGIWPPNYAQCENKYGKCWAYEICEADRNMREEEIRLNFVKSEPWDIQNEE